MDPNSIMQQGLSNQQDTGGIYYTQSPNTVPVIVSRCQDPEELLRWYLMIEQRIRQLHAKTTDVLERMNG